MKLIKLIKYIHFRLPSWASNSYMPLVGFAKQLASVRQNRYVITGEEKTGESPLKVVYVGSDIRIRDYWINTFFKEQVEIQPLPRFSVLKLRKGVTDLKGDEDLMLVELTRFTRQLVPPAEGYVLPRWFDTLIEPESSLQAIKKNNTPRHIEKYGFSYTLSHSMEDLEFFYTRMFKPLISGRHKDAAVMVDFSYFRKKIHKKDSLLFLLMKDGNPVAASFNERKKGMIKFSGIGVLDGDREIIKMGAMRVLYHFMISYYHEKQIKQIDFGGTSPILTDGLTQFKHSMRAIPNMKNPYGEKSMLLKPLAKSPALQEVLNAHPFVFLVKSKYYRALFLKPDQITDKKSFLKWLKRTNFRGMERTRIHCWGDTALIRQWLEEEALADLDVIDYQL